MVVVGGGSFSIVTIRTPVVSSRPSWQISGPHQKHMDIIGACQSCPRMKKIGGGILTPGNVAKSSPAVKFKKKKKKTKKRREKLPTTVRRGRSGCANQLRQTGRTNLARAAAAAAAPVSRFVASTFWQPENRLTREQGHKMPFLPPGAAHAPRGSVARMVSVRCLGNGLRARFCHGKHLSPRLSDQGEIVKWSNSTRKNMIEGAMFLLDGGGGKKEKS